MTAFANVAASAARIALVTAMMVGPVYALSAMKDDGKPSLTGAGIVLVVNLQRSA